ncbi:STAS/SEC14 domain-containing protein [Hymenobacter sp. CRA2]|uniref:STAS/SEC14 domain-containing protein n=1 Tax=Hymenobacter sp. CRA2 TaxID=1955620 RepID=UPI00098ECE03|nr:STAS/SEC14 domain-containing protein [Hymenobacter sp. CRA2]OON69311.1 hypothetical protein B0919_08455 [Hymenobacter sp. CRA2]
MLRALDHPDQNLLTLTLDGAVSKADYDQVVPLLEQKIARYGKANVCVEVRGFDGISLRALWEDIKQDVKHYTHFHRVAVLSADNALIKSAVGFAGGLVPATFRHFPLEQLAVAEAWARGEESAAANVPS